MGKSIAEGLRIHGIGDADEQHARVVEMLDLVGLRPHHASRFPHEFSGGQRQRIGIARALILRPTFVVADEPVSALDVSVQAQVLNLLKELQEDLHLTLLFVAHNLAVVEHISDRVAVMYLGKVVELTDRETLYRQPLHPYTEALLAAIPVPDPDRPRTRHLIEGEIPSPSTHLRVVASTPDALSPWKGYATSRSPSCGRAIPVDTTSPRAICAPASTATSTGRR